MSIELRSIPAHRLQDLLAPLGTAFGTQFGAVHEERVGMVVELDVRLGAYDDDAIVGAAGSYGFSMTVPGGVAVETAGLTMVGVIPTHRRRGILRALMREHLDRAHARGQVMSALFASEGPIYGRFGFGLATVAGDIDLPREHTAFVGPAAPACQARLLGEREALAALPPIWERVRLDTPGMLSRSPGWWRARRVWDPEAFRGGRGPLQRVLLSRDGRPCAYALYRFAYGVSHRELPPLEVVEAIGDTPEATRALWRYLLDLDLVTSFRMMQLPTDHPLFFLLADPRRLSMKLRDAVWVRLVDVGAALSRRGYGAGGPLVIAVEDALCPWNTGRYRLADGVATRTEAPADLAMDVAELSAAYLGGVTFTALASAGRVREQTAGALERGDALFRGARLPWCPETF
jgi:predicted acetyltransferase